MPTTHDTATAPFCKPSLPRFFYSPRRRFVRDAFLFRTWDAFSMRLTGKTLYRHRAPVWLLPTSNMTATCYPAYRYIPLTTPPALPSRTAAFFTFHAAPATRGDGRAHSERFHTYLLFTLSPQPHWRILTRSETHAFTGLVGLFWAGAPRCRHSRYRPHAIRFHTQPSTTILRDTITCCGIYYLPLTWWFRLDAADAHSLPRRFPAFSNRT